MKFFYHWIAVTFVALAFARKKSEPISNDDHTRTKVHENIPAMEYLGCGYDILYGNPLADLGSLVDPGYRNPIISFALVQTKGNGENELKASNIPGSWIRPLVSCNRSSEKTVVRSMNDYRKALSMDSAVGGGSLDNSVKFSLSAGYIESSGLHLSQSRRLSIQRNYCFLLEAALPVNGRYAFKKSFKVAVSKLRPKFRAASAKCTTIRYAMDPDHPNCLYHIKPWMELFELFGTHFSYNIKIGGRLTEIIQEDLNRSGTDSQKEVKVGADAQVARGSAQGYIGVSNSRQSKQANTTNVSFKYVNVLGGRATGSSFDEDAYLEWIQSIPENPMPIRSQFAPISKLLKSNALKEAYDDAMEYYMELKGVEDVNYD